MIGDTTLTTHRVRYSAAYPTGRERMLEPQYGCAGESFAFGGKPHEVRPEGPQGAARERMLRRETKTTVAIYCGNQV